MAVDDHHLAVADVQPSWVLLLADVTVLCPHQRHQHLLQLLDGRRAEEGESGGERRRRKGSVGVRRERVM